MGEGSEGCDDSVLIEVWTAIGVTCYYAACKAVVLRGHVSQIRKIAIEDISKELEDLKTKTTR